MDEKKKSSKKVEKKGRKKKCLESAGDGLGTLVGVQIAQKNMLGTRLRLFQKKNCRNLTVVLRIDSYESN